MKLSFIFLITLSFCQVCFGDVAENNTRAGVEDVNNHSNEDKLKFDELNYDVFYHIFDQLELIDFIRLAETNSKLNFFATNFFRNKFPKHHLRVNIQTKYSPGFELIRDGHCIYRPQLLVRFLKNFGKFVRNIVVDCYDIEQTYLKDVIGSINEFCSESLSKISFLSVGNNIWDHFTKPFPNVEKFYYLSRKNGGQPIKKLNEMFPNINRLNLGLSSDMVEVDFTDCHLPHLKQVRLCIDSSYFSTPVGQFVGNYLLAKNPQIQNLKLSCSYCPNDTLSSINRNLPNLPQLKIERFIPEQKNAHFQNVKILTIEKDIFRNIRNVRFSSLQELYTTYATNHHANIFAFLQAHNGINRLHINGNFNETIETILAELPNLTELSLICGAPLNALSRILNLDFQQNLTKVTVYHEHITELEVEALRQSFENKWMINNYSNEQKGGFFGQYLRVRSDWKGLQFIRID